MTHIDDQASKRYVTACHEAGHAVAGHLRGGEVDSISIQPTAKHEGIVRWRVEPRDPAFTTYAGPWAEARAGWPHATLDGEDDDGCTFDDYVTRAFEEPTTGTADYLQYQLQIDGPLERARDAGLQPFLPNQSGSGLPPSRVVARDETWHGDLERAWPRIQQVAEQLLNGDVDTIRHLLLAG